MRVAYVAVGVLMATRAFAAEPRVFYTASFPNSIVELSILSSNLAQVSDYDFEVDIGIMEVTASGAITYTDSSSHIALVRCRSPIVIGIGHQKFYLQRQPDRASKDWKIRLWYQFCSDLSS